MGILAAIVLPPFISYFLPEGCEILRNLFEGPQIWHEETMRSAGTEFPPTPWSLIVRIQRGSEEERTGALETVCENYWQPIYVFARMSGYSPEDAEDLTQEFFAGLERSGLWDRVEREMGRLRSLLIGAFKRTAADQHRRNTAEKRGGMARYSSFDRELGEQSYSLERLPGVAPDAAYDHAWALTVFSQALGDLKDDYVARGKARLFAGLQPLLMRQGEESHREAAAQLEISEGAIKSALFQLRSRYREQFRRIVKDTLTPEQDLDEEVRYLLTIIKERGGL